MMWECCGTNHGMSGLSQNRENHKPCVWISAVGWYQMLIVFVLHKLFFLLVYIWSGEASLVFKLADPANAAWFARTFTSIECFIWFVTGMVARTEDRWRCKSTPNHCYSGIVWYVRSCSCKLFYQLESIKSNSVNRTKVWENLYL